MDDETQHWCPVHELHGEWNKCALGVFCGVNEDGITCTRQPIAPDVVETIEAAAIRRVALGMALEYGATESSGGSFEDAWWSCIKWAENLAKQEDTE